MCFIGKDADRVTKLLVNNLGHRCHWLWNHILPFMSTDWVEVKVRLYSRVKKAAVSQAAVAHGCCPGFPALPCSRTGRQGMCVAGEGGEWGYWDSHHSQSPRSLPLCRTRWFHSLLTLGTSLLSHKGAVWEPSEWPRLSITNTVAPQEETRCYCSFVQLRYCCISSSFLKKKVFYFTHFYW